MKKLESLESVYIYIYIIRFNKKEKIYIEKINKAMCFRRI